MPLLRYPDSNRAVSTKLGAIHSEGLTSSGAWSRSSWSRAAIRSASIPPRWLCAVRTRGVWLKGAITLEYLMNVREAPFPNTCDVVGELLFNPRMVHSGWGLDQFPDPHLSAIAHAGMDAILVFVEGVDRTPDNRITRVSRIAHRLRAPSRSPVAGPPGRPTRPGRTAPQPRHRHRVLDVQLELSSGGGSDCADPAIAPST